MEPLRGEDDRPDVALGRAGGVARLLPQRVEGAEGQAALHDLVHALLAPDRRPQGLGPTGAEAPIWSVRNAEPLLAKCKVRQMKKEEGDSQVDNHVGRSLWGHKRAFIDPDRPLARGLGNGADN